MGLVTAYLYVTLRCNARCGFCRLWREQGEAPPDMPLELGIRLLDDLRRLGAKHVDFTGGEPTLYGPLPELLRHANKLGFFTSVTSNGLLYERRARELQGLLYSLGFSLNGHTAEIHDKVQGVRSFDRTISSIRLARELGEQVHAHFTASSANIHYMDDILNLAGELEVPLVIFPEFSYFGNQQLAGDYLEKLTKAARNPNSCVNMASVMFQKSGGNDTKKPVCTAGKSALAISPEGSIVLPCFHSKQHQIPTDGRLYETYLRPDVQQMLHWSGRFDFCRGCTNWCYINPSFAARFDKYALLHAMAAARRLRGNHDPWLRRTRRVIARRAASTKVFADD